jgi:hypothetical protein
LQAISDIKSSFLPDGEETGKNLEFFSFFKTPKTLENTGIFSSLNDISINILSICHKNTLQTLFFLIELC